METRKVTKAATFKRSLYQSYKKHTVTFFVTMLFNYFHETKINRLFLRVTGFHIRICISYEFLRSVLLFQHFEG